MDGIDEESYFRDHPDEIDDYINLIFEEYAADGDTGALLSSLRVLCRAKGVSKIAEESGLSRKGVQKALSENGKIAVDGKSLVITRIPQEPPASL